MDKIQSKYLEIQSSKGYLILILDSYNDKNSRECCVSLLEYRVGTIEQCYSLLINTFERLPINEFPENYKDFEDDYIRKYMDCAPVQYKVYSLDTFETIHIDIHMIYELFLKSIS